ncbi:hypothetical protein [Streptosporangium sp. NPDC002607]
MGELVPGMNFGPTSQEIGYSADDLDGLGNGFGREAPGLESLGKRTAAISIGFPAFGVVGIGLLTATDQARDSAAQALEASAKVLNSWKAALAAMAEDMRKREKENEELFPGPGSPGLGTPDLGGLDLGGTDLGDTGLPGTGFDDTGLPGTGLPGTGLPGTGLPDTDGLDPTAPGARTPDLETPDLKTPGTDLPDSNTPTPDIPAPNTDLPQVPDTNIPGLDPGDAANTPATPNLDLPDPGKTDLAGYTPPDLTTSQPRVPEASTWSGESGRSGGASPFGAAAGGGQSSLAGARGAGLNGMAGMPFMPMGGAGDQKREIDNPFSGLSGDEGDWDDDADVAPAVLGQEQ